MARWVLRILLFCAVVMTVSGLFLRRHRLLAKPATPVVNRPSPSLTPPAAPVSAPEPTPTANNWSLLSTATAAVRRCFPDLAPSNVTLESAWTRVLESARSAPEPRLLTATFSFEASDGNEQRVQFLLQNPGTHLYELRRFTLDHQGLPVPQAKSLETVPDEAGLERLALREAHGAQRRRTETVTLYRWSKAGTSWEVTRRNGQIVGLTSGDPRVGLRCEGISTQSAIDCICR